MSVTSLALDSAWRDWYGNYSSFVEPQFSPLEKSKCHAPRFALLPAQQLQIFNTSGKITYNFRLEPGSIIWGLFPMQSLQGFNAIARAWQLTDVNIGHALFQEPSDSLMLTTEGQLEQNEYTTPILLPAPWPVVGDGLFTFEAWGDPDERFYMVLGVAEVTSCPVR